MLDNFYTHILTSPTGENGWSVHIRLNPEHPLYQGHFPEQPIVPGVCMLQFIKESVEAILQERAKAILQESVEATSLQKLQYTQIASCKFLLPIDPVQHPELVLALELKEVPMPNKPNTHCFQLQAEGRTGTDCFIKLKAQLVSK